MMLSEKRKWEKHKCESSEALHRVGLVHSSEEKFDRSLFMDSQPSLSNSLSSGSFFRSKAETQNFLSASALPVTARAEELEPAKFLGLFVEYEKLKNG